MIAAVVDTHAVIWYLAADPRFSSSARRFMETVADNGDQIALSSITFVELVYLIEKRKIPAQRFSELATELGRVVSLFVEIPVDLKIARSLSRIESSQIPDMPDRIIAATALSLNVPLISRDGKITLSSINTVW